MSTLNLPFLTPQQAAPMLGVTHHAIYDYIRDGKLVAINKKDDSKKRVSWRIDVQSVHQLRAARQAEELRRLDEARAKQVRAVMRRAKQFQEDVRKMDNQQQASWENEKPLAAISWNGLGPAPTPDPGFYRPNGALGGGVNHATDRFSGLEQLVSERLTRVEDRLAQVVDGLQQLLKAWG